MFEGIGDFGRGGGGICWIGRKALTSHCCAMGPSSPRGRGVKPHPKHNTGPLSREVPQGVGGEGLVGGRPALDEIPREGFGEAGDVAGVEAGDVDAAGRRHVDAIGLARLGGVFGRDRQLREHPVLRLEGSEQV